MSILEPEKVEILNRVIQLSKEYQSLIDELSPKNTTLRESLEHRDTEDGKKINEAKQRLIKFLDKQSFEDVQMIETIMYIGRDPEEGDDLLEPESLYSEVFSSLRWDTKEIEIKHISQKTPLNEYLEDGMKLLRLK